MIENRIGSSSRSTSVEKQNNNLLSNEFLIALEKRAAASVIDLNRAVKSHQESRTPKTHGALILALAAAQRVAKLLLTVKEQHTQLKHYSSEIPISLFVNLESHRIALRRALPIAVAAAETSKSDGAADTVNALRSLMHTRSLLNVELRKVQGAVDEIVGSSESLQLLQNSLQDVNATVEVAQRMVRKLMSVKTKDDIILRISLVVFLLVVLYIFAQRVFGFFPTKIR